VRAKLRHSEKQVRTKLRISRDAHSEASSHYSFKNALTSIISAMLSAAAGILEATVQDDHMRTLCVASLIGVSVVVQAFLHMSRFQALQDRHSHAAMLFNSLLQDFDFKFKCTIYPTTKGTSRQQAFDECMAQFGPQVAEILMHVPPMPGWIVKPIQKYYESKPSNKWKRQGCLWQPLRRKPEGEGEGNNADSGTFKEIERVNKKLKISRDSHSEAMAHYKLMTRRIGVCSVTLIAAIGVFEAVLEHESRMLWVLVFSALNGILQSLLNMSAFQSLQDRHLEASMMFNSFVMEFQFKVLHMPHARKEEHQQALETYMKDCGARVTNLLLQVPPVPQRLIAPISRRYQNLPPSSWGCLDYCSWLIQLVYPEWYHRRKWQLFVSAQPTQTGCRQSIAASESADALC